MSWLGETRGARYELVRHFLRRMLDGEWSSGPGQWQPVAASAFAFLLPAGVLLLDPRYAAKYRMLSALPRPERFHAAALADELSMLTLATAITGMLALLAWHSLFPSGRDYLALAGLPVRSRDIFSARLASVALFSAAVVTAMNLLPTYFAPLVFVGRWQKDPSYFVNLMAHGVSAGLACFFVFFALVALQGVLLNALPGRLFLRLSTYVQGLLIGVLLLAALYSGSIGDWGPKTIARLPEFGVWLPPVWFAGLHEYLLGDRDPFLTAMAGRAVTALVAALGMTLITYLISYRRYRKLLVEMPVWAVTRREHRWSLLRLVAREPQREAIMRFMATTLTRSRSHRMIWLAYLGATTAALPEQLDHRWRHLCEIRRRTTRSAIRRGLLAPRRFRNPAEWISTCGLHPGRIAGQLDLPDHRKPGPQVLDVRRGALRAALRHRSDLPPNGSDHCRCIRLGHCRTHDHLPGLGFPDPVRIPVLQLAAASLHLFLRPQPQNRVAARRLCSQE